MRGIAPIAAILSTIVFAQTAAAKAPTDDVSSDEAPRPGIKVDIAADNPNVTLYELVSQTTVVTAYGTGVGVTYRQICRAPCRKTVDREGNYFIGGNGVTGTGTFGLPADGDRVQLNVKAGSAGARVAGWGMATPGFTLFLCGSVFAFATSRETSPGLNTAGWAMFGGGALLLGAGIYLIATSGTSVTTSDGATLAKWKTPLTTFNVSKTGTISF